jgi:hypothetical protein
MHQKQPPANTAEAAMAGCTNIESINKLTEKITPRIRFFPVGMTD